MERTKEEAREKGYVVSPFGRRCWVPGIADKNAARRAYAERQAINAPLQGGAADIIKRAMVRLPAALREAGLRSRLLLQVHDELLFEAPEDEADALAAVGEAGDGERGGAVGAAGGGDGRGADLGGGALRTVHAPQVHPAYFLLIANDATAGADRVPLNPLRKPPDFAGHCAAPRRRAAPRR